MLKSILVYPTNNNVIALLLMGWSQLYLCVYAICLLNTSIHSHGILHRLCALCCFWQWFVDICKMGISINLRQ